MFDNKDAGTPHNVSLHLGGSTGAELFKGTIFNGIESRTYDVPAIDAGQYAFVCTVHPDDDRDAQRPVTSRAP